jgi:hypothetical protein
MKAFTTLGAAVLFLSLGTIVPAFAQETQQEAKPAQQEKQAKPAQQAKPAAQQAKPAAQQEKQAKPAAQQEKQVKPAQQQKQANKPAQQEPQTKQAKQEPGKTAGQPAHQRSAAEEQRQRAVPALRLSARASVRIPEEHFRANFGEGHRFVISQPVFVGGYSRFQYSGFWFGFVEPWPEGWYYSDDVYVDYVDGDYFLFNPFYPGVRVAIVFVP